MFRPALLLCISFMLTYAQAQDQRSGDLYAAFTWGAAAFLDEGAALEVTGNVAAKDLLFGLDVRGGVGLLAGDALALKLSADALYPVSRSSTLSLSIGAGPRFVVGRAFDVGAGAVLNLDLASLDSDRGGSSSLFIEPGLDLYFIGATQLAPKLGFGVRYDF